MATEGSLTGWLMSMVTPIVRKVLSALGFGWVTFEGSTSLLDQVRNTVVNSWGGVSPTVYDILALGGMIDAVGIILGALAVIATLAVTSKLGRILA